MFLKSFSNIFSGFSQSPKIQEILSNPKLKTLTLKSITDSEAKQLSSVLQSQVPGLKTLVFAQVALNKGSLSLLAMALEKNTSIERLDLTGFPNFTQCGASQFAKMLQINKSLKVLNLVGCKIESAPARQLVEALAESSLVEFNMSGGLLSSADDLATVLKKNKTLKTLKFWSVCFLGSKQSPFATGLTQNSTLTSLNLGAQSIASLQPIAATLLTNTTLVSLNLEYNIARDAFSSFAPVLTQNNSLRTLNLSAMSIDGSCQAFAKGLRANKTLIDLELESISIKTADVGTLMDGLVDHPTLQFLNLASNNLGPAMNEVARLISDCRSLRVLKLSKNNIDDTGAADLGLALQQNYSLTELDLYDNKIKHFGMEQLAVALCANTTLKSLNLSHNSLGSQGGIALAQALGLFSLHVLNLEHNDLDDEAGRAIAQGLSFHPSLRELYLGSNQLKFQTAEQLGVSLTKNSTLIILSLFNNKLNTKAAKVMAPAFSDKNNTLKSVDLSFNDLTFTPNEMVHISKNFSITEFKFDIQSHVQIELNQLLTTNQLRKRKILLLLLLARRFCPESPFYAENLALDVFKLITQFFAGLGNSIDTTPNPLPQVLEW